MKRKIISILTIICMIVSCITPAFAEDTTANDIATDNQITENVVNENEMAEWEANLGEFTQTPTNAYTPSDAQNLLNPTDDTHAYSVDFSYDDEEASHPYVDGEILFAKKEGGSTRLKSRSVTDLSSLGITDIEEVYRISANTSSGTSTRLMARSTAPSTVWYKAKVDSNVLETVNSLKDEAGIYDAEPNYIYETDAVGLPEEVERNKNWFMNDAYTTTGMNIVSGWAASYSKTGKAPGDGTIVAVIDTGVDYNHEDLKSSMWINTGEIPDNDIDDDGNGYIDDYYGINTTANPNYDGAIAGDPMDNNGHGTHVAGIIAMANNNMGGVGIAYGAKIMAIKAGQSTGTLSSSDIAAGIKYAKAMGADVINMSFGGTGNSALVREVLEDAFGTCVLVASSGNDGLPTIDAPTPPYFEKEDIYPAGYNFVLGVMASDNNGGLAAFSNWDYIKNANAEYEIVAPGTDIYSTLPGNRYAKWNGTSMAAPCVSAAAAILRSCYSDATEYNSRFIMGQLASASDTFTAGYTRLNLYQSLTRLPEPNLSVSRVFALDNTDVSDENDGDRIIDAGETADIGIEIRNQWGKTGEITITADAVSDGGVANEYVTFINDTITLDPAGAFSNSDNEFVWNDGYLEGIDNPIQFTVAPETPNDTEIKINLTVTTTNGWDENDTTEYTIETNFTFRVQNGQAIRGHISEDTTLTNDKYWIIENALVIDEGATLTVEQGTQIQFWSSDYEDAYGGQTMVYINNKGTLNMIGTEDDPIEMFPGDGFEKYVVQIYGDGEETLEYCNIINQRLGYYNWSSISRIEKCDHCSLIQNYPDIFFTYLDNGNITKLNCFASLCIKTLSYSKVEYLNCLGYYYESHIDIDNSICNQFNKCNTKDNWGSIVNWLNCTYIGGKPFNDSYCSQSICKLTPIPVNDQISNSNVNNCAILNPILNTDSDTWVKFTAPEYEDGYYYNLANNYWGTENDILINKMIIDDDDAPGVLGDIVEKPILTLADDLSDIYPFVTDIYVTEENDDTLLEDVTPGNTYDVHVTYNRDMAQDILPMVTYGGDAPYTDNVVSGSWVSDKEWVGTTKISSIATGGTQIFRTKGGCAADDKWLECGADELRFQFNINSASVLSMVLNATGYANEVRLSWAQNDFDTFGGYNLYRSTNKDYGFEKINETILTDNEYIDTDVEAGVDYYYYFTIVDTDGNEVPDTMSNIAKGTPLDNIPPTIVHTPVTTAKLDSNIAISAKADDNIEVNSVYLYYRAVGADTFTKKALTYNDATDIYTATIPQSAVTSDGVEYYLEAVDNTGNSAFSGSAAVPYVIQTDSTPTLLTASPSVININSTTNTAITVYGTGFEDGMEVKFGDMEITDYTLNEDGKSFSFTAPILSTGSYEICITVNDHVVSLPSAVTYRDTSNFVQLNSGRVLSGETLKLPLYVGLTGDLTAFHAEINIPSTDFTSAEVELADGISATVDSNYIDGVLKISLASAQSFKPQNGTDPLMYLVLTPATVDKSTESQLTMINAELNGSNILKSQKSSSVTILPNYTIKAFVKYFKDLFGIEGVKISADGRSAITTSDGNATLSGISRPDITITADKDVYSDAVGPHDAALILRYRVDLESLDDKQLIAADVDGNGVVNEVDASLILKKSVFLIDHFTAGSWKFAPSSINENLTSTTTDVEFTAILVGDVDGNYNESQQED